MISAHADFDLVGVQLLATNLKSILVLMKSSLQTIKALHPRAEPHQFSPQFIGQPSRAGVGGRFSAADATCDTRQSLAQQQGRRMLQAS